MVKRSFAQKVYQTVKKIPKGKVTTYSQVARKAGSPRAARAVGNLLHRNTNHRIPCHRVVSQEGRVSKNYRFGGGRKQKEKLLQEGVAFKKDQIDLKKYQDSMLY